MDTTVMLGHGSGGTMMKRIIDEVFFAAYAGDELLRGDDAAVLPALGEGERLAFSTDSFVVTPHFFPGGDIGRLAVCGTVNDVATSGARPLYLSCGFILEEGFPIEDLKRICASMAEVAREAGVVMTDAGATWPYGKDPHDSNIRIAPTLPPLSELDEALDVFVCCVKLAYVEKLLG